VRVVNVQNNDNNAPDFIAPIVTVDLPAYTELDERASGRPPFSVSLITVDEEGNLTELILEEGKDFTVKEVTTGASIGYQDGELVTDENLETTRYIFEFDEDIVLKPTTVDGAESRLTIS